jgi:hypothetical protein
LPTSEKVILADAWVSLNCLSLLLRGVGFRRAQSFLAVFTPGLTGARQPSPQSLAVLMEQAAAVAPFHYSCLTRSLTLWWLLLRCKVVGELCIGVRKNQGRLEAHAWVEQQGVVLNDAPDIASHYATFDSAVINRAWEWK